MTVPPDRRTSGLRAGVDPFLGHLAKAPTIQSVDRLEKILGCSEAADVDADLAGGYLAVDDAEGRAALSLRSTGPSARACRPGPLSTAVEPIPVQRHDRCLGRQARVLSVFHSPRSHRSGSLKAPLLVGIAAIGLLALLVRGQIHVVHIVGYL